MHGDPMQSKRPNGVRPSDWLGVLDIITKVAIELRLEELLKQSIE